MEVGVLQDWLLLQGKVDLRHILFVLYVGDAVKQLFSSVERMGDYIASDVVLTLPPSSPERQKQTA